MSRHKLLIADDDVDLVELLEFQAKTFGLQVLTAHDATSALQLIDQELPDVVILDVHMPGGTGLGVREMMMENETLRSIPAIILTGRSDEETVRRCHSSLAYYITKCPGIWSRIEPVLREILAQPSCDEQTSGPIPETAEVSNSYENSDQKALFDWMFDLMDMSVPSEPIPEQPVSEPQQELSPWILCIDDDDEMAQGLQIRFREHGVRMLRASEGMEGYRRAFMDAPQAIILDFEMPAGNGDYVLRRLKETPATQNIPVIVFTGRKGQDVRRKMYNLGANDYLSKPCPWEELWGTIEKYLHASVVD